VPQVLTNSAEDFLNATKKLKDLGYREVNINMGCPSGTVVSKGKGAGILEDTQALDLFLENIFEHQMMDISIKTRIGMEKPEEWEKLLEIYNKYPIKELIVHARVRTDYYKNKPNFTAYDYAISNSKNPICYNGDIFSLEDFKNLQNIFTDTDNIMLGRGLIANPFLAQDIYTQNSIKTDEDWSRFQAFHDEVYLGYQKIMSGDTNVLFKMKELWSYMSKLWPDLKKQHKQIYKSRRCDEYEAAVKTLLFTKN